MNHRKRLEGVSDAFRQRLATIRTDRPSAEMFAHIQVDLQPGATVPLRKMASITVQDSRTVVIETYERSGVLAVEKGLRRASFNPTVNGTTLFVHIAPMSEERRTEICRSVREIAEEFKLSARTIRREWLDADESSKIVEAETKAVIQRIDELSKQKQAEIRG